MAKKPWKRANKIQPGMAVEATRGDLGEEDISKPKVKDVIYDTKGNIEKIIIEKGLLFKKELEIPADRIQDIRHTTKYKNGSVSIDAREAEIESLNTLGSEELADKNKLAQQEKKGIFDDVEENIPTAESIRQMELISELRDREKIEATAQYAEHQTDTRFTMRTLLRTLGPGFIAGMAGNDSSAVTTYSIDGAQNGYGHLWLLLLSTPMYQAVQYTCAKIGRVTQQGLAEVLRENYGRPVAILAALVLVIANVALIAADLVAIGSGLELITNISWIWFVVPIAAILWYFTVFRNFATLKKIFVVMSLAFVVYIVTIIIAHPNWGNALFATFVPHINLNFASISAAVALLGATISPYNIFWQVQGEKEEKRSGTIRQKIRFAALDIAIGVVSGNLIAYFIIVTTATTLFHNPHHHGGITTAADAAQALVYVLGPFARYLFAIGLIGAGLVAIPVLLASTSYAVAGTVGWPVGLSKKPWQNEGFYLILTIALLVSLALALLRLDPINLIFWANVLSGILAPVLIIYLLIVGNNRKIMRDRPLSLLTNIALVITVIVMVTASGLLFYGLFTGMGG
jgi:NRAMP (natural resistance-associated macrophage protein)-like metal ion transporter